MTATSNPRSSGSAEVRHVNYQSDFRIVFSFPENKLPQYPWRLELSTPNTPGYNVFVAWFDGENYHNCKPQEDGTLLVPVDNHDLAPGVLTYKINIDDADADFPDGFMNVTIPGTMAVELWAGPSDEFAGEIGVVVLPVKGDPGPGVPAGGKTGQMLAKQSDADYDTVWVDPTSAPTINVVQTTGQSEADVMSQKAVTDALDKKVDAEEGKGLSSNDYTNLDKNKVASAVLFSPQTLTPQQQEQARKNIGGDNSYISFINGQTPIQGIRYVDVKDYPNLSGNYAGVFYDEDQQEIYCLCDGNSTTGGVVKISKNKVVAYLNMDVSSNGCERPIVKIGEYLYVIQLGWRYNGMLSKLNANDLSIVLQVKDSDKIGYNTPKGGLFFIGEELYLWGIDGVFYSVNKEDLSFTPIFSNIQYVLQFDYTRLVIADDTDIFEFTGGTEKGNSKPIPEGFETISELAIGGMDYRTDFGVFIYIRNGSSVTSFYTVSSYGGGKLTLSTRYSSNSSRIYSCRKLYNDTSGHDSNVFRDKRGVLYVSNIGNGKLSSTPSITVDALGLNAGPYLFGSTPIYPTYRGFLM